MLNLEKFWDEAAPKPAPLKPESIPKLEERLKVKLPATLIQLLKVRNGGEVRDSHIRLASLKLRGKDLRIDSAKKFFSDDFAVVELIEEEVGDPAKLILFGYDDATVTFFALNYNGLDSDDSPDVVALDMQRGLFQGQGETVEEFLEDVTRTEKAPTVDWDEAGNTQTLFSEVVKDVDELSEDAITLEQKVYDTATSLLVFNRVSRPEGVFELVRTEVFKPISAEACFISTRRDKPMKTYGLILQPEAMDLSDEERVAASDYEANSIHWMISNPCSEGRWKNAYMEGNPPAVVIESVDKDKLEDLRTEILGAEVSDSVRAQESLQDELSQLSEEEFDQAFPGLIVNMFDEARAQVDAAEDDALLAGFNELLQETLSLEDLVIDDLRAAAAGNAPVNPKLQSLVNRVVKQSPGNSSSAEETPEE